MPPRRREISFSQGAVWKALISRYIGTIPLSGDVPALEHHASADPTPRTHVSSAMIAKVGAAARCRKSAARAAAPSARAMPRLTGLAVAFPEGGLPGVRDRDPFRVGRGVGDVTLVPVPPFVRPALGVACRRVLPLLLTPERRHVEVVPDGAHRLVAAAVDEVGAEDALAVTDERVVAVPFIHPEVGVKTVGDGVPGDFPAHPRLQARDVGLWCTRGINEGRVARVQMGRWETWSAPSEQPMQAW